MATVLYELDVTDGHNVHFVTGGRQYMLRFQTTPTQSERDEAILLFEQREREAMIREQFNESEEVL